MRLLPKFLTDGGNRLLSRVSVRYRGLARAALIVAAGLFLAFEMSRAWLIGRDYVLPVWQEQFRLLGDMAEAGNWLGLVLSAIFFVLPLALLASVWRGLRRRWA